MEAEGGRGILKFEGVVLNGSSKKIWEGGKTIFRGGGRNAPLKLHRKTIDRAHRNDLL